MSCLRFGSTVGEYQGTVPGMHIWKYDSYHAEHIPFDSQSRAGKK